MPVRLRITLLFTLVVFFIMGFVCWSTYYFSYQSRIEAIKTRLTNRAITTATLLSRSEIFNRGMVERIDSLTTLSLKNKSVQAYNFINNKIYSYSDVPFDTIAVSTTVLDDTRVRKRLYFTQSGKDVIAYYYNDNNTKVVMVCGATDEDGKNNLNRLKNILLVSFITGLGVAVIGGYIFSRRLLRPIKKIAREVTEISAYSLTRRIQTGHVNDEWYQLSKALNELLDRLQESFELHRRFISNASHELSTPLTAILSQLEISLQRERSGAEYQNTLSTVIQDVKNMTKLTHTLLEFAKASGNKGGLEINLVRIDEILMELPASMKKQNKIYEVKLQFGQLPENEEDLLVFGNPELLTTAIHNIVSNACKYSVNRKAIVNLELMNSFFVISVADRGAKIPSEERSNIFHPFYRIETGQNIKGFGLGLSLAYRIIKLHKGDIIVDSGPGEGNIFSIRLPFARSAGF